uniref:CREG-like beta-barrel domain-containing protein n=1 Tax=Picea sitchensis TaxID=3332 RepID=B8LL84_PICSI|nr:unknown [Picea sitchensis]
MEVALGPFVWTSFPDKFPAVQTRVSSVENCVHKTSLLRRVERWELGRCQGAKFCFSKASGSHDRGVFKVTLNSIIRGRALSDGNEGGDDMNNMENGYALLPEIALSSQLTDSSKEPTKEEKKRDTKEEKKRENSIVVNTFMGGPSGGSRTGLFRTPISGGVQSATSAHGLPRPALAVRNLMEQARFAHLCTVMSRMHHRRKGYPFGSLVDFAPDSMGHPIFSLSPLAIHTRNLLADPRCSLVVQIPGWSGLSNARVTIFGDVYPLPDDQQEWAHAYYTAKHQQGASQQWGNFYYYRMELISDVYFIGGFGTVAWVDVHEYENVQPDKIAVNGAEQNLKELNAMFSKPLRELLSTEIEVDDAALISIDSKGTDIRVRQGAQFNVQRISFESSHEVETLDEAKIALKKIVDKFKKLSKQT